MMIRRLPFPKLFPWRVFYRAFLAQALIVLLGLVVTGLTARYFFKRQFIYQVKLQLQDSLGLLSKHLPEHPDGKWCAETSNGTSFHFKLIGNDGKVICDSHPPSRPAEKAGQHPEVQSALEQPFGESIRFSNSENEEVFYGAIAIPSRQVILQGEVPLTLLSETMRLFDTSLGLVLVIIGAASVLWAIWSARAMVFPLGRLLVKTQNLLSREESPLPAAGMEREPFDEWLELESNIDSIRRDMVAQSQILSMEQVQLETIMAAISDAILAVDLQGIPLFFNSRFGVLFGAENLRRHNVKLWELFREPEILSAYKVALQQGRVGAAKAFALEKGGLKRFFSLSVSPLRNNNGSIYGAVGIFHDVTDLKSAEQMRIDFVANATHELRTPLTSIKGYADTLSMDIEAGKPVDPEFVKAINRNTERLLNLMNDLLDLSSLEAGDILHKELIGTEEYTQKSIKNLQGKFDSKNQSVAISSKIPRVLADPDRLDQVLVNLLDNANKYAPEGGKIMVDWEGDGTDVLLKVSNNGPGIPIEHQSRLFERFYRVDKARSREQGGTGLGLAIVKHIMQRHEGTILVESQPGEGATFICRFPGPNHRREEETSAFARA